MRNFYSYVSNDDYSVGCTGQTVYLFDRDNNEIAKFKDIIYAYTAMISPDGKLFVVKSTVGRLAVYSLEMLSLIKKFRFSKVDGAQDDGFCFSPDGKLFINVERQGDSVHSAISIYDTTDFSLVNRILFGNDMMIDHIEFDKTTNKYYVLGFMRGDDGVMNHGFVAKFEDYKVKNITAISDNEYECYQAYKESEMTGFASKGMFDFINCDFDELKKSNFTLAKLYMNYNKETAE